MIQSYSRRTSRPWWRSTKVSKRLYDFQFDRPVIILKIGNTKNTVGHRPGSEVMSMRIIFMQKMINHFLFKKWVNHSLHEKWFTLTSSKELQLLSVKQAWHEIGHFFAHYNTSLVVPRHSIKSVLSNMDIWIILTTSDQIIFTATDRILFYNDWSGHFYTKNDSIIFA